jgi:tight adherence protein B
MGRRQREANAHRALRDALRLIVDELRAGASPVMALDASARAASPVVATALRAAANRAREDGSISAALLAAEPLFAPLGHAWGVAEQSGIALAEVVSRVADDLDAELERGRAVSVALASPRATAALLAGLPVLGLVLGTAMGAHPLRFLCGPGWVVAAVGLAFDVCGLWWTHCMISRALR